MKTISRSVAVLSLFVFALLSGAQSVNLQQSLVVQGLEGSAGKGSLRGAVFLPDGSLVLLENNGDGLRLVKTDAAAATVIASVQRGAAGDAGIALASDAAGNVYVCGTSTSGQLAGTTGVPFPMRADTSTNSFVAKFDASLTLQWLSFLGAGRTAAAGLSATDDGVFVTGVTYNAAFPVTAAGIQQKPASGTSGNGFVERFTKDGSALTYATYLTGVGGDTAPAAIAADASGNAYVAGLTSASGFPTISALEPAILSASSGFLLKLTPAGDGFTFSTFVAGSGLTGLALDAANSSLLASGNVALGQFPVATATQPLVNTSYQVLLRIALDGQSVQSATVLAPGTTSSVSTGGNGSAWVSGTLAAPLLPGSSAPLAPFGDGFLVRVASTGVVDQTARYGALPVDQTAYVSASVTAGAPAVSSSSVVVPSTLTTSIDASTIATAQVTLPFRAAPTAVLNALPADAKPTCSSGRCSGSAGLLSEWNSGSGVPALALSTVDAPNVTLQNLGTTDATGVALTVNGFSSTTNCGTTLAAGAQCSLALAGAGPGSISVSAANASTVTATLGRNAVSADALALSTYDLDFGVSTAGTPSTRALTITNVTGSAVTFTSGADSVVAATSYAFAESSTDCAAGSASGSHTLAANASCHLYFALIPSTTSSNDGVAQRFWRVGSRAVLLWGYAQANATSLSATELDFGTQFAGAGAVRLPRYLFLSNSSDQPQGHAIVTIAAGTAFTVLDECPSTLAPHSVCRMTVHYDAASAPSRDSITLNVDGTSVLLTGTTLQPSSVVGSTANPNLTVTPTAVSFSTDVPVTGVSSARQSVTVKNNGAAALAISTSSSAEFPILSGCPATLAGGASCVLQLAFAPSAPGVRQGVLAITGGAGFEPFYVTLSGSASALLPANNGLLELGQTYVGEPVVQWYRVQQTLTSFTASVSGSGFGVAIVSNTSSGHGTLPASAFAQSATAACANCWIGIQYLSGTAGSAVGTLTLTSTTGGNPYVLSLTAQALPISGLLLTPVAQDFGTVGIGSSSAPVTFTLANLLPSGAAVTLQTVTASGDFSVVNSGGTASCGSSLPSTAACAEQVIFTPSATGQRTGSLRVVTSGGTVSANLLGYGTDSDGVAVHPASLVFENVPGTAATQLTLTLSNTAATALQVGTPASSNAAFLPASSCGSVAAGSLCTIVVSFTPQTGPVTGTLMVPISRTVNGQTISNSLYVELNGAYAASTAGLRILPAEANFGAQPVGTLGLTRQFVVENFSAQTLNLALTSPRQFPLSTSASSCTSLAPNTSCVVSTSFLPSVAGEATGSLSVSAVGNSSLRTLTYLLGFGAGFGTLQVTGSGLVPNTPLSFGSVQSGQSAQQVLTVTNTGTAPLAVRRISSLPPFLAISDCGVTLAANASCSVTLTFSPSYEATTASGPLTQTGQLTIESEAEASPYVLNLTGQATVVVTSSPSAGSVLASYELSEGALTFANTGVGNTSAAQTVTLTNIGNIDLHVSAVLAPTDFAETTTCATVQAGGTCTISVAFQPGTQSSTAVRSGALQIRSDSSTPLDFVTLLGTSLAAPLTLAPAALTFGTVNVGQTSSLPVTVTNTSQTPVTFRGVSISGDYTVGRGTCPPDGASLAAGSSCTLNVAFQPTQAGTRVGTLSVASDATSLPLTVAVNGTGAMAQLTVSPAALPFGSVALGASAQLSLTLLNSGNAPVTGIAATVSGTNAGDFNVVGPCSTTQLAPNQGCTVTVAFAPSVVAAESATLVIASSDPKGPLTIPLAGAGVAGGSFTLTAAGGASAASTTVKGGFPASYSLMVTPTNGYTGDVALTCSPVTPAPYAGCSLLPSRVTLTGGGAQAVQVTITTVTSQARRSQAYAALWLMALPLGAWAVRRKRVAAALAGALAVFIVSSCGGSAGGGNSNLRYTPVGTYSYVVTATSTSGTTISQSVTLTLTVQ